MVIVSKDTDRDQVRACTTCINMLTRNRKKEEQKQAAPPPILRYYEVSTNSTLLSHPVALSESSLSILFHQEVKKTQDKLGELIPKFNEEMTIFK